MKTARTSPNLPQASSTTQQIVDSLRTDILRGKLRSQEPLRQDEIAGKFGVSKIPVREALVQLRAEGLVTFYTNRGAFVSELSAAEADEIYVMRIALEIALLKRAIPNLTVAQLKQAEEILTDLDRERNIAKWGELNWDFHAALYSAAHLPRLMKTTHALHANIARYLVLYLSGMDYQKASQREHRVILEACRHGEVRKAAAQLKDHLQSAASQLVAYLDKRNLISSKKESRK